MTRRDAWLIAMLPFIWCLGMMGELLIELSMT